MKEWMRMIAGYALGGTLVLYLIPSGLYRLSQGVYPVLPDELGLPELLRGILAGLSFVVAFILAAWSNAHMFRIGKGGPFDPFNVAVSPQTRVLMTDGPYRFCRNPMLLGAILLYAGFGFAFDSWRALLADGLFALLMVLYVKRFEERRLMRDFGEAYRSYRERVPMLLPRFRRRA